MNISSLIEIVFMLLNGLVSLYMFMIVIYCLLTWLPNASFSRFGQLLARSVNPVLRWFSFARIGMVDLSPVAVLIFLQLLQGALQRLETMVLY